MGISVNSGGERMKVITVEKSAMGEVLKMLGYNLNNAEVQEIAAITKDGLVKKDLISMIELSDKIKD